MMNTPTTPGAPWQKIREASRITGFSQYILRQWCREGSITCKQSGKIYYIFIPDLLKSAPSEAVNV